ncbi:MAG: TolC family protein [Methylomonas sp.]|nr:TolC family protein [Methylomonas sp.]
MNVYFAVCIVIIACGMTAVRAEQAPMLSLDEVQTSALRAFPALLATEQVKDAAEGREQEAQGGFDTLLKSKNELSIAGLYENRNYDVSIEQPTAFLGTTFFGGWRRGTGDFPGYEGKRRTATDGEARIGVNVPLWRNRDIDRRRASLVQAELGKMIANHEYDQSLIEVRRVAGHRYWDWVLAGLRLQVAEKMLAIAEERNNGILERVAAGDIPEFEALDNQRAIIERRERVVAATRLLEQAAIQLSLYWRDANGEPQLPGRERLPAGFPEQTPAFIDDLDDMLDAALAQRPEIKRLAMQMKQTETEIELQINQQAPGIDFSVMGAKDVGDGRPSLNRDELYLGLNVDFPLQQRVAGGRAQTASANLRRLQWDRKGMEDRITAEVKDVLSALMAARQRLSLSRDQLKAASQLEDGEQTRFALGESTILFVNLREIAAGDAAIMVIDANNTLFKAHVDQQAIIGQLQ